MGSLYVCCRYARIYLICVCVLQVSIELSTPGEVTLSLTVPDVTACDRALLKHTLRIEAKALLASQPVAPKGVSLRPQSNAQNPPVITELDSESSFLPAAGTAAAATPAAAASAAAPAAAGPSSRTRRGTAAQEPAAAAAAATAAPAAAPSPLPAEAAQQLAELCPNSQQRRYMVVTVQDGQTVQLQASFADAEGKRTSANNAGLDVRVLGASPLITATANTQNQTIEIKVG